MAQEQFAGPEYYTEFDPERFAKEFAQKMAAAGSDAESSDTSGATADDMETEGE